MTLVFDKYDLVNHVGTGSFGDVYVVRNIQTDERLACKIEINAKVSTLKHEANMLQYLSKVDFTPNLRRFGSENGNLCMIMDLYDESLDVVKSINGVFSYKNGLLLMHDLLEKMRKLHELKIIHRDIKPDNFLIERKTKQIKIIDFGLSKKYLSGGKHIEYKTGKNIVGTTRYISVNIHKGIEASRRDDLISLGYMVIWLQMERLPWQGIKATNAESKLSRVKSMKSTTTSEDLCRGIEGDVYVRYMDTVMGLDFQENPDYEHLIKIFAQELRKRGWYTEKYDFIETNSSNILVKNK